MIQAISGVTLSFTGFVEEDDLLDSFEGVVIPVRSTVILREQNGAELSATGRKRRYDLRRWRRDLAILRGFQ